MCMCSKCWWKISIGVGMWAAAGAGAAAAGAAAAASSCPWLQVVVGGVPAGGGPLVVVVEVAVPPVPLARLGVAVTGMVPVARPLTEVAVATVVAVPT